MNVQYLSVLEKRLRRALRETENCVPYALDPDARHHLLGALDNLTAAIKAAHRAHQAKSPTS